MAAYYVNATVIIARLGTARAAQYSAESGSTPDSALIDLIQTEVEAMMHTYIAARVEFVPVPYLESPNLHNALSKVSVDIGIYRLAQRKPPVPDDWKLAYDAAMKWLEDFRDHKIELPDPPITAETKAASGYQPQVAPELFGY